MTDAIASYSTALKIGDGATSEAFTTIAEVVDIGGVPLTLNTKEVTSFDSAGWAEFIGTKLMMDDVEFKVNFIPTNATHSYSAGLIDDMLNRTLRNFQLVFPDSGSTTWTFAALVTGVEVGDMNPDGGLEADVTLKPSGAPTLA